MRVLELSPVVGWDDAHDALRAASDQLGEIDAAIDAVIVDATQHDGSSPCLRSQDEQTIGQLVAQHLQATVAIVHAAITEMAPRRAGRIVTITEEPAAERASVVYDACMAGVRGLAVNLAVELPDHGMSIASVSTSSRSSSDDVAGIVAFLIGGSGVSIHGTSVAVGAPG
jgi:NAD(P)-dependent dehydrogenase (short-subunit alcohol dehydrogenase family)